MKSRSCLIWLSVLLFFCAAPLMWGLPPRVAPLLSSVGGEARNFTDLNGTIRIVAVAASDAQINASSAYFNVTDPSGYTERVMPAIGNLTPVPPENYSFEFSQDYNSTVLAGEYAIVFYVEGVDGNASTARSNFTVYETTLLSASAANVELSGVSFSLGQNVSIPVNVSNVGNASAVNVAIVSDAGGWHSENRTLGNISALGANQTFVLVSVPANASPGEYPVSFNVTWRQLNHTYSSILTASNVSVLPNRSWSLQGLPPDGVFSGVLPGVSTLFSFNITGEGNAPSVLNLTSGGNMPNIAAYFSGDNLSFNGSLMNFTVAGGSERTVFLNFSVARGEAAGIANHAFYVNVSGSQLSRAYPNLTANVTSTGVLGLAEGSTAFLNGIVNNSFIVERVVLENRGNLQMELNFSLAGNMSAVLDIIEKNLSLDPLGIRILALNFTAPSSSGTYSGRILANGTGYAENIPLAFDVHDFGLNATNFFAPQEVLAGDLLNFSIALEIGGVKVADNVTYGALVGDAICRVNGSRVSGNLTFLSCIAPNVTDAAFHNLSVLANYSGLFGRLEAARILNGVYYKDVTPPVVFSVSQTDALLGNSALLNASVGDNNKVDAVFVAVSYPSGANANYTLSNVTGNYTLLISNLTELGDYFVVYHVNDTSGNYANATGFFEVYLPAQLNGTLRNAIGEPLLLTLSFYRRVSPLPVASATTVAGNYNFSSLHARAYDLVVNDSQYRFIFRNVNITQNMAKLVDFDFIGSPPSLSFMRTIQKMFAADSFASFAGVEIELSYADNPPADEGSLRVIKCPAWNYSGRRCIGLWEMVAGARNAQNKKFYVNVTSFSAYALGEYVPALANWCGDSTCSPSAGESCATCPQDCGQCSPSYGGYFFETKTNLTQNVTRVREVVRSLNETISALLKDAPSSPDVYVDVAAIYADLLPGGNATKQFALVNSGKNASLACVLSGSMAPFITILSYPESLASGEAGNVSLLVSVPENAAEGEYAGELQVYVDGGKFKASVPVRVRVLRAVRKVPRVQITVDPENVVSGETFFTGVDIGGVGEYDSARMVFQAFAADSDAPIFEADESVSINGSLSFAKQIKLPPALPSGRYLLKARALFSSSGSNRTVSVDSFAFFTVSDLAVSGQLKPAISGVLILALLCLFIMGAGRFSHRRIHKITVDVSKLPKTGIFIGTLCGTKQKAFLELEKLQTHTIVAGATGGGKTVAAQVVVEEALMKGVAVIVFDPTAQWSGFLRKCADKRMLRAYPRFHMRASEARAFSGNVRAIADAREVVDVRKFMVPGEINVFTLNRLDPKDIDLFVASTVKQVFRANLEESQQLKLLIVYDEVHRLLPKFGGSGEGFIQIERACREFRKWGVGLLLISQVLSDFIGAIKANIGTEIQVRTRDEDDLERFRRKYGDDYMDAVRGASEGLGIVANSEYNHGMPFLVEFRPLLHSPAALPVSDLSKREGYAHNLHFLEQELVRLKERGVDVSEEEVQLKFARDGLARGRFGLADAYLTYLGISVERLNEKSAAGKTP